MGVKIAASYYPKMPGNKVPYTQQHVEIINEVEALLKKEFPGVPMRWAWTMDPETVEKAVDELITKDKVKTIVHCDIFPVYSSLEQFNTLYQDVKDAAAERAKVVFTPYPGAYPSLRKGVELMATDEILPLPKKERKLLVLTRHGWPDTPGDPFPGAGPRLLCEPEGLKLKKPLKEQTPWWCTRILTLPATISTKSIQACKF